MGFKIPSMLKRYMDRGERYQWDPGFEMPTPREVELNLALMREQELSFALADWNDRLEEITSKYESDLEEVQRGLAAMGNHTNMVDRAEMAADLFEKMQGARSRYRASLRAAREKFENKTVAG